MEALSYILTSLGTILATLAIMGPKLLVLLETIEAQTAEGTRVDETLDKAIKVISLILRFATVENSNKIKALNESIQSKKAE